MKPLTIRGEVTSFSMFTISGKSFAHVMRRGEKPFCFEVQRTASFDLERLEFDLPRRVPNQRGRKIYALRRKRKGGVR